MADSNNKLGLTVEERAISYSTGSSNRVGEMRHYDPTYGYMQLHDPMLNTQIEFIWDAETSTWKGTGVQSGYTATVTVEELTPLVKQDDSEVAAKVTTVSRFPS
jgi:hypothetical protein